MALDPGMGRIRNIKLGGQARVVIVSMGVGTMTGLRGNVDVLAKTKSFHLRKDPFNAGLFFASKKGGLSGTNVVSDDITTGLLIVFELYHLFLFHFLQQLTE